MAESVFRQLDELDELESSERSVPRRTRHSFVRPRLPLSQNDGSQQAFSASASIPRESSRLRWDDRTSSTLDEIDTSDNMILDRFDEQLLKQPQIDRRYQAAAGVARLSLPRRGQQAHRVTPPQLPLTEPRRENDRYRTPTQRHMSNNETFLQSKLPIRSVGRSSSPDAQTTSSPALNASIRRSSGDGSLRISGPPVLARNQPINHSNAPPMIQGICLVPLTEISDRLRSIFPFDMFNAIQSKCFPTVFKTDDNFVLSSPTGSGKTVVLELAICRLMSIYPDNQYKIVYQAPTKSLCAERTRDWQRRLNPLGLKCTEMTGDSDNAQLRGVQNANVVITTPEKWDSMTRKWKDHEKLMRLVKLFLIDEVHILKEDRGATLEAVVSRMKSVGSDVRFVALSATVPNSGDVAAWLGRNMNNPHQPAHCEHFGEDFRPVKLQKHVVGFPGKGNDFAFDKLLTSKLNGLIVKYSHKKPMMVFCFTRKATVETAKHLTTWWLSTDTQNQYWSAPNQNITVNNNDLRACMRAGVAFHHAGLDIHDREAIEKGFLRGDINVICCTSTLAVGVNLPCHMVIIKNTACWQGAEGCKEYADLEVIQMLGRAGRPQFDTSAVAVVMTKQEKVRHYEQMVSGQEYLESCLHLNLIDHLNSEIALGTVSDVHTAQKWLQSTFLSVRLAKHPNHYKLEGDRTGQPIDELLQSICSRDISSLQEQELVTTTVPLHSTEFGDAMARYYIQFETMKIFLSLPEKPRYSNLLAAIAQASEYKNFRFRQGDKPAYKQVNDLVRFPIKTQLSQPSHLVSITLQAVLGGHEKTLQDLKGVMPFNSEVNAMFQHAARLIRCIIDCQLQLNDSIGARNALFLSRCLAVRAWEDTSLQLKQIDGIGPVAVHKLSQAGIKTVEDLDYEQPARIQMLLSKNPPWGHNLLEKLKSFPKLRVSLSMQGYSEGRTEDPVRVNVKAEIGFLNDNPPLSWQNRHIFVCFLAETSDGHKIHFCRMSSTKLGNGQDILFTATLTDSGQVIACHVMCDDIAGTEKQAILAPKIPGSKFPKSKIVGTQSLIPATWSTSTSNQCSRRQLNAASPESDYGLDSIDDADLLELDQVEDEEFLDVDVAITDIPRNSLSTNKSDSATQRSRLGQKEATSREDELQLNRLPNGKFECNHQCKDKTVCKHLCCREGIDKPHNRRKKTKDSGKAHKGGGSQKSSGPKHQKTLNLAPNASTKNSKGQSAIPTKRILEVDLTDEPRDRPRKNDQHGKMSLHRTRVTSDANRQDNGKESWRISLKSKPAHQYTSKQLPPLSFMHQTPVNVAEPIEESSSVDAMIDTDLDLAEKGVSDDTVLQDNEVEYGSWPLGLFESNPSSPKESVRVSTPTVATINANAAVSEDATQYVSPTANIEDLSSACLNHMDEDASNDFVASKVNEAIGTAMATYDCSQLVSNEAETLRRRAAWVHDKAENQVTKEEVDSTDWFMKEFGHCVELVDSDGNAFEEGN